MNPEQFRTAAHRLVDWIADYQRDIEARRVVPDVAPGFLRQALPAEAPEHGESFERILADFETLVVPGMTHWQHPGFFAYFPGNASPPSQLAELLTSALAAQCMSWQTSPAATELEQVATDWLRRLWGLDEGFHGVIQDTSSSATLVALLSARERATDFAGLRGGLQDQTPQLMVYASAERHSSVDKAVRLAGLGLTNLRLVPVDENFALKPALLESMILADLSAGRRPCAVVATVGSTSSTAVDPLRPIGEICRRHGVWLHIDASYAGTAAMLPEKRWIFDGAKRADSLVVNPHKWMMVNFDCSAYFVRDVEALLRTASASPEFLRTAVDGSVPNFRDWGVPLGRRFRALKLWWVLRAYGAEGLREILRAHCAMAKEFESWVRADERFEVVAPVEFGLVCFRLRPAAGESPESIDQRNRELLERVNADGRVFLTHTSLSGRITLRLAIGQRVTERRHVELAWELARQA